jgi:heptaprenyl diphosphate synthase
MKSTPNGEWLVSQPVKEALKALEMTLLQVVATQDLQLQVMTRYLIERGGKRLRPALVFLAADFRRDQGEDPNATLDEQLQLAGAAMELMHVASLYHDDVMDRAPQRRKGESANHHWGNLAATLAGTFLFARAAELMASLGEAANHMASESAFALCSGQLQEVENAYNLELSEDEYLKIIGRKTGVLFELPCRLGATLSSLHDEEMEALADYGRNLGLAFQLADDTLDLTGAAERMGKSTQTDLREGVYSLPVLRAIQRQDGHAARLKELLPRTSLSTDEIQEIVQSIVASGAVAEVKALAREYLRRARRALDALPEGDARISLDRLAEFVVARNS